MIGGVQNIGRIKELRDRILFTFAMLAVYRLGAFVVTPGINPDIVKSFFEQMQGPAYLLTLIDEEHPAGLYGHPKYRRPTNQVTAAFLDAYLRDDSAGLEAIEPIDGLYEWRSSR